MPFHEHVAQRAHPHRSLTVPVIVTIAATLALGALSANPQPTIATIAVAAGASASTAPTATESAAPAPTATESAAPTPTGSLVAPSASPTGAPLASPTAEPAGTPTADSTGSPEPGGTPSAALDLSESTDDSITAPSAATSAARPKVVVVAGPVGGRTRRYVRMARALASQARSYGAQVIEIYSPNATWARVRAATQGANLLVYLGHGNGWPGGHGPFDPASKNGLGLNAAAGRGNSNTVYYGESIIASSIRFAPGAVVVLNHLCYASGNNEWGRGTTRRATAIARVDNYAAGFIRAGAAAVIAEGLESPAYVLRGLFTTNQTIRQIFWNAGHAARTRAISFASRRTSGVTAILDPYRPGRYYRSVIGNLEVRASAWR